MPYVARYLNNKLPAKTMRQNLRPGGAAEGSVNTGLVIFLPDELNHYNYFDIVIGRP
jgi:hypothetical protein